MENARDADAKDLERFYGLEYPVIMKKRGESFFLFIPELSCFSKDTSLEKAYEKLESAKKEYLQKMLEYGFQGYVRSPSGKSVSARGRSTSFFSEWLLFGTKFLTVLLVVGVLSGVALNKAKSAFGSAIGSTIGSTLGSALEVAKDQIRQKLPDIGWGTIKQKLHVVRERLRDMPADEREKKILAIRELLTNVKPFTDEFMVLMTPPSPEKG